MRRIGSSLVFYILETSKVISGWAPTCDNVHTNGNFYSAAPLGNQTAVTQYPTQSHYPATEPTSHCTIQLMLSAKLGSDKY